MAGINFINEEEYSRALTFKNNLKLNKMSKEKKERVGRPHKFKVEVSKKYIQIPTCILNEFEVMYEDLTREFLNDK